MSDTAKELRTAASGPGKATEDTNPAKVYQVGEDGGWPTHNIDWDAFYAELNDLRYRYGGVDYSGSPRIRLHVTDLRDHYHHNYTQVPLVKNETPMNKRWGVLRMAESNVKIALEQLSWVTTDCSWLKEDK
jgi:hypothetical protein